MRAGINEARAMNIDGAKKAVHDQRVGGGGRRVPAMAADRRLSLVAAEPLSPGDSLGPVPPLGLAGVDPLAALAWRCLDEAPAPANAAVKAVSAWRGRPLEYPDADDEQRRQHEEEEEERLRWLSQLPAARHPQEQNLEVTLASQQLQLRVCRPVQRGEPLLAWFSRELADLLRLPAAPRNTPNAHGGEKSYRCPLCSDSFANPYPVVSHLMYRCPARHHAASIEVPPSPLSPTMPRRTSESVPEPVSSIDAKPRTPLTTTSLPAARKVKGFDIASLTDCCSSEGREGKHPAASVKDAKLALDRFTTARAEATTASPQAHSPAAASDYGAAACVPDDLSFKRPSKKRARSDDDAATTAPPSSAFKKVDKTDRSPPGLSPVAGGFPFAFPYGLPPSSPLCAQFPLLPVFGPLLDPKAEDEFEKNASAAGNNSSAASAAAAAAAAATAAARRFLPAAAAAAAAAAVAQYPAAAVLPYLPPSLAALSLPSQNWCAKCQTSFRMTSDLVYHMRSHHKREPDPAKKRREDKLRCHICHESFRERHHLTRHMTSHQ
nr:PR domain zinc finger protein 8-like [Rhipicephalus microplus]